MTSIHGVTRLVFQTKKLNSMFFLTPMMLSKNYFFIETSHSFKETVAKQRPIETVSMRLYFFAIDRSTVAT